MFGALEKLGLSKGEAKVYVALAKMGSSTVGPVVRKSKISSSKVYIILEKLIDRGLVSYVKNGRTKEFSITDPKVLKELVRKKELEINETKNEVNKTIPELQKLRKSIELDETAKIFRGVKALRAGFFEAIRTIPLGGEYLFFSRGYGQDEYLKQFFRDLALSLKDRKIRVKGIANKKEKQLYDSYYKKYGYKVKYTSLEWPSDITIAGSYLLLLVWDRQEPVLYQIQSSVLTDSYRLFFKNIYNASSHNL